MNKVIVVGAGIAGLTAAYSLQKQGFEVQVIEASSRVGGRMITDSLDGYTIDCGAQFLSSAYPILVSLIFELGLQDEFIATSPWTAIRRGKTIYKFRYDDLFSPVKMGLLELNEWLKLGINSVKFTPHFWGKHLNNYSDWRKLDVQNATEWYNVTYGKWMTEYIIEPVLEGFYFQTPEETSRALAIAVSGFLFQRAKTMTLKHGIGSLPLALGEKINVALNEEVQKIVVTPEKIHLHTNRQEVTADKVVLAVPAYIAKKMYFSENQYERELLSTPYSSTVNLALGMAKEWDVPPEIKDVYGLLIPRIERTRIAAIAVENAKYIERAKSGHLINIMIDSKSGNEMINQNDDYIFQTLVEELDVLFPKFSSNVIFHKLYRWKYAEPKSPIGRAKNIFKYREEISPNSRILLAGDYMGMPFTEGAAETGLWAASSIARYYEKQ